MRFWKWNERNWNWIPKQWQRQNLASLWVVGCVIRTSQPLSQFIIQNECNARGWSTYNMCPIKMRLFQLIDQINVPFRRTLQKSETKNVLHLTPSHSNAGQKSYAAEKICNEKYTQQTKILAKCFLQFFEFFFLSKGTINKWKRNVVAYTGVRKRVNGRLRVFPGLQFGNKAP